MLIAYSLGEISLEKSWVAVGSFDGVHRGHQALISSIVKGAHQADQPAVVVTFHPHPREVLKEQRQAFYLTMPEERVALLSALGIDAVVILEFNSVLAGMPAAEFVQALVSHLGMVKLFVGRDFALGNLREGNLKRLRDLGKALDFQVVEVDPIDHNGMVISSSQIRSAILNGNVAYAAQLLGRPYQISGLVDIGDQRGRQLGIPTANITIHQEKLSPAPGVYACQALVNDQQNAAAVNIGIRPTFEQTEGSIYIEAHLLDYSGNLYGKIVTLRFVERLRDEMKFGSVDALIAQVKSDIQRTRAIIVP